MNIVSSLYAASETRTEGRLPDDNRPFTSVVVLVEFSTYCLKNFWISRMTSTKRSTSSRVL